MELLTAQPTSSSRFRNYPFGFDNPSLGREPGAQHAGRHRHDGDPVRVAIRLLRFSNSKHSGSRDSGASVCFGIDSLQPNLSRQQAVIEVAGDDADTVHLNGVASRMKRKSIPATCLPRACCYLQSPTR